MNPIIKFTTLFGLLAVEIAVGMSRTKSLILSGCFLVISMVFVWRSFYAMRITTAKDESAVAAPAAKPESACSQARDREGRQRRRRSRRQGRERLAPRACRASAQRSTLGPPLRPHGTTAPGFPTRTRPRPPAPNAPTT